MTHVLWLGRDNEAALALLENGTTLSLERYDAITRVTIDLRPAGSGTPLLLDSAVAPVGLLAWGTAAGGARVVIEGAKLADVSGLTAGRYRARVTAFSVDQPLGIVFADYPEYDVVVRP